jgi:CheY-specific phosphatase CheX
MDLQNIFYIIGIIAMVVFIALTLVAIYFIFFVKTVITRTEKKVIGKIMEYTKPVDVLSGMAGSVAGNIILQLKQKIGLK